MKQAQIHIDTQGEGQDLVMLHGWGVNSAVFTPLHSALHEYRVHYVDLPGFGLSQPLAGDINLWVDALIARLPEQAIWAGWSLGGLVATRAALNYPHKIKALATIASSPCFMAREAESWPGIPPAVLAQFATQLGQDLPKTIERFLAIQAMGTATAKEEIKRLKALVLAKPLPSEQALAQGLGMLTEIDLRPELAKLELPWLRLWGRLDGLVPRRVTGLMPQHAGPLEEVVFAKASHAPFFSHQEEFVQAFTGWLKQIAL
ncbi:pimeloyl-ACP methyl ester esterase BioH [Shewanella sp. AS16]|uniref:pimeloyl-ACP methyl ester esterase BioH n=1 Tax=Shewanella sp. AS16 TaxID=2907625 RepID=UPI002DD44F0B|nr:pimeloyl-ACP methyl ester esterase BioH [Shewanella sp. AS16]